MNEFKQLMKIIESNESLFIRKIILFRNPDTGNLDYRVAYFTSEKEANIWQNAIVSEYENFSIRGSILTDTLDGSLINMRAKHKYDILNNYDRVSLFQEEDS